MIILQESHNKDLFLADKRWHILQVPTSIFDGIFGVPLSVLISIYSFLSLGFSFSVSMLIVSPILLTVFDFFLTTLHFFVFRASSFLAAAVSSFFLFFHFLIIFFLFLQFFSSVADLKSSKVWVFFLFYE